MDQLVFNGYVEIKREIPEVRSVPPPSASPPPPEPTRVPEIHLPPYQRSWAMTRRLGRGATAEYLERFYGIKATEQ
jgi:hypothetical protein